MAYLPNINFNQGRRFSLPDALGEPEYTTEPIQVLRDAFEKYIVQSPVQSNTIGIQVIFTETGEYQDAQTLFITKRQYLWPPPVSEQLGIIRTVSDYIRTNDIANGASFSNDQIDQVVEYLQRDSFKILEIVLCEVYNDDEYSRDIYRRSVERDNQERYYPFTIPIKVLYRGPDANNQVYNSPAIVRRAQILLRQIHQSEILGITLPQFQQLFRENPRQIRRQIRDRERERSADQRRAAYLQRIEDRERERQRSADQRGAESLQRSRQAARALGLTLPQYRNIRRRIVSRVERNRRHRAQQEQLTDPEAQQRLLDEWPVEITQSVHDPNNESENPNPLQYINDQILLNKPLNSYVWPGICQICQEEDKEGLCRVNCKDGHIFHCHCINTWRNTRNTNTYYEYGWRNDCPVCHEAIESMVQVTPMIASKLPTEFGKKSKRSIAFKIKEIDAQIKYLKLC
jgi:hypothetical protein